MQQAANPTWKDFEPVYQELADRELSSRNVNDWLHDWSELEKEIFEQYARLSRAKNEDTANKSAEEAFLAFVNEVLPKMETASQGLKMKLLALEEFQPETDHEQFVKRFRNEVELFREANVPLFAEGEALNNEYNKITGALSVELDGETMTIPQAERKLLEPDRELRERAWRAIHRAKLEASGELDKLFLKLLGLRRQIAKNAGFDSYRDYCWLEFNRFDYRPEDSLRLHESIAAEAVPLIAALRDERKETLGVSDLRPWDLQVDLQSRPPLEPFETVTELEAGMERIFARLEPDLGQQFHSLRDGWLDLESRQGKVPGLGYQSFFYQQQMPYIYWSVNGSHLDVTVLLHEAGHSFHSLASVRRNDLIWNFYPGIEFAEVASQAMELLTLPYLTEGQGGFYTDEDAARARRENLERVLHQLPGQAQSDAFQHWLYTEAPEKVTIDTLDEKWLELSQRFSPGVDWRGLERERAKGWQYFHIFTVPFYMLEYSMAWLGAIQIWRNALQNQPEALRKYREALALGGTRPLPELFESAGATFAFDQQTVGELMRFVYDQLQNDLVVKGGEDTPFQT